MATSLTEPQRTQLDGIVQRMHANGESDEYIQGVVNDFKAKVSSQPSLRATPGLGARLGNRALAALPSAGGFVGGLAGGALGAAAGGVPAFGAAVGGAAVGGAVGKAAQEAILGHPLDAGRIAGEGALQGGYEAAGGAIGAGLKWLAKPIMHQALGVEKSLLKPNRFPKAVQTAVAKGITADARGAAKANALRMASVNAEKAMRAMAAEEGFKVSPAQVTAKVRAAIADPATEDWEKAALTKKLKRWLAQYSEKKTVTTEREVPSAMMDQFGRPVMTTVKETEKVPNPAARNLGPDLLQKMKQKNAKIARGLYDSKVPGGVDQAASIRALFAKKVAGGTRQALNRIPGVEAQNAMTKDLIGAQIAAEGAAAAPPRLFNPLLPQTWPGIASRSFESRVAIKLADPNWQKLYKQSPRLFFALLGNTDQPDATDQP